MVGRKLLPRLPLLWVKLKHEGGKACQEKGTRGRHHSLLKIIVNWFLFLMEVIAMILMTKGEQGLDSIAVPLFSNSDKSKLQ